MAEEAEAEAATKAEEAEVAARAATPTSHPPHLWPSTHLQATIIKAEVAEVATSSAPEAATEAATEAEEALDKPPQDLRSDK